MAISDEISGEVGHMGGQCTVTTALNRLTPAKRKQFLAEMAGPPDGRGNAIAKVLGRHSKVKLTGQTVNRHRKGECACAPR